MEVLALLSLRLHETSDDVSWSDLPRCYGPPQLLSLTHISDVPWRRPQHGKREGFLLRRLQRPNHLVVCYVQSPDQKPVDVNTVGSDRQLAEHAALKRYERRERQMRIPARNVCTRNQRSQSRVRSYTRQRPVSRLPSFLQKELCRNSSMQKRQSNETFEQSRQ